MNVEENKLGVMPIKKLLFQVSFPMVISMMIQSLYNLVDSFYIGKINEAAFSAISIAFPIQNIMVGIAVGTGVGMNALISKHLGEKRFDEANLVAENGLFLAIIYSLTFFILSRILPTIYLNSQTTEAQIITYGVQYLRIVMGLSLGIFLQIFMERVLQSTGRSVLTMMTQLIGAVLNIILDPIFIFGRYGFPEMGVMGAAIATVIGQIVGACFGFLFQYKFNKELTIKKPSATLNIIKDIFKVGVPSTITFTIQSFTIYILNGMLSKVSTSAVAALGAYFKVQSFVFMPVFGLNNGMVPIVAYNYGARNKDRILGTIKLAFKVVIVMTIIVAALIFIFPKEVLSIFSATGDMLEIGVPMLRICACSYIFAGMSIVGASIFQAFGNGLLPLLDSILRQIIILIPFAYFALKYFTINEVWYGYIVAEFSSVIFIAYFMNTFVRRKLERI